ncbi:angiogenic factor with G patch and FHA domains 1 [Ischnura elegans]|uniref:angiogenic factor with G patch and FHA domains 1 n=1 Tax=Ischnura elegans TaxID=197161 RepID=UPI001ED885B7|nr:angiogenic factor with G patch and FHA domains 1 [Ischnura elegans]
MDQDSDTNLKDFAVIRQLLEQNGDEGDGNLADNDGDIGSSVNDINPKFLSVIEDIPEVKQYIELLHRFILIQHNKLLKFKEQLVENSRNTKINDGSSEIIDEKKEKATQTDNVVFCSADCTCPSKSAAPSWSASEGSATQGPSEKTIAEQVKEAAEHAMQQTGFVYEETSGMYYDYSTGYYYNAELGLYYDGNKGIYYYYDESNHTFQFHSQAEIDPVSFSQVADSYTEEKKRVKLGDGNKKKKSKKKAETKEPSEPSQNETDSNEDGECSESSEADEDSPMTSEGDQVESEEDSLSSKEWPPCMRIIVKETEVKGLKVGTLFIVTCTGGTLGREGDHAVSIPDINISKHHGKFTYEVPEDGGEGKYFISDFGSRNGTYLNGERLSVAKQESEPQEVVHGSIVQVGSTKLLCHIHRGSETCGHCEPGLVQREANLSNSPNNNDEISLYNTKEQHKKVLKRLKKKFGLESNEPNMSAISVSGYEDRAQSRRLTVGSQDHHAKTETASMEEAIRPDNKGYELLSRMGWSKGQSLGKEGTGLTEPVPVIARRPLAGLGSGSAEFNLPSDGTVAADPAKRKRLEALQKTKERYDNLPQK